MLRLNYRLRASMAEENEADSEINMTPLIDMIFILLIFFLVTASFVRESGVEIERPGAASASDREKPGLMVAVTAQGEIYIDHNRVELSRVRGLVERHLAENPGGGVMIEADRSSYTGRLVEVLDQCRLAGAKNIHVAAATGGH